MKNVIDGLLKPELEAAERAIEEREPVVRISDLEYRNDLRKVITILECIDSFT